jgi:murein L,D-transpeptidase YcbB/YkuD
MAPSGRQSRLRTLLTLGMVSLAAVWAVAPAAHAQAPASAPAEDALKQIIEEGNPAYLDWSAASSDRDQIGKLYEANGYRLLWSDGEKPTAAAISLLQELRLAGERGLDPEDYPGNRLAYLLIDLIDAPHSGIEQWALFDAGLTRAGVRFLSDVHWGRIDPAMMGHDLSVGRIKLDIPSTLAHLATAVDVAAAVDALEPQFSHYALLKGKLSQYRALAG